MSAAPKKKKKEVTKIVKLQIPAGQANPSPPVGPALGQAGLNIMEFCNAFNDKCKKDNTQPGAPIPVRIFVYKDKSFDFITKKPPVSYYLKQAAKIKKGSGEAGKGIYVGKVTKAQIREIAEDKMQDLNAFEIEAAMRQIEGTAFLMAIEVVEG